MRRNQRPDDQAIVIQGLFEVIVTLFMFGTPHHGNPALGFVRDQLRIWRQVTARGGVALSLHHSGVWRSEAMA